MIGYILCGILGAACGFFTCCMFVRSSEEERIQEYELLAGKHEKLKTDHGKLEGQYWDLQLELADLDAELKDERYRHDRLQDFCVAQGKQQDAAKADLRRCSTCFTCADCGTVCPEWSEPEHVCECYRWRGVGEQLQADDLRTCEGGGDGAEPEGIATPVCALARNDGDPLEVADG